MKAACFVVAVFSLLAIVRGENWPQFRGPTHQGLSTELDVPLHWSSTSNILWKTPVYRRKLVVTNCLARPRVRHHGPGPWRVLPGAFDSLKLRPNPLE